MPLNPAPGILDMLARGMFPEVIQNSFLNRPIFGDQGAFQHLGVPFQDKPFPFSQLNPQAQSTLGQVGLDDFFKLVQGGAISPGFVGQSGTGLAPMFNFSGDGITDPSAFVLNALNQGLRNPTGSLSPEQMFDAFKQLNFFGPMQFPQLFEGGGFPNISPPGQPPPNITGKGGGLPPPDPPSPPDEPPPDFPDFGFPFPFPIPDFGGGPTISPQERVRRLLNQIFPYYNPGGVGTPPTFPGDNPAGGGAGGFFPGFPPVNPGGFRPQPVITGEPDIDESGRLNMKNVIDNVLRELLYTIPGALRQGDPIQQALLSSGTGLVPHPFAFQSIAGNLLGPSAFSNFLSGQDPLAQTLQSLKANDIVGNSIGTAGPLLGNSTAALNHILTQGLPGQGAIQNQIGQNFDLANQLLGGPNSFINNLTGQSAQGPGAALQNLFDPSKPFSGVSGPVQNLNSIFQLGIPGQQSDISNRQGIEGLLGNLTNIGRGGLEESLGRLQGLQQPGIQGTAENALTGLIQGGGLSPDFVKAQQERILEPAQDQLVNRLNSLSGGFANLGTSGVAGDALARQSSDFNNDLLRQGFQNFNNAISQGVGLGGQQFGQQFNQAQAIGNLGQFGAGQAPNVFNTILQGGLAPVNAFSNLTNALTGQNLGQTGQQFDIFSGLQQLGTQQFGAIPAAVGPFIDRAFQGGMDLGRFGLGALGALQQASFAPQQLFDQRSQQASDLLFQMLGGAQGILGQQQNFGLGVTGQGLNPLLALLNFDAAKQARAGGNPGAGIGEAIAAIFGAIGL